MTLSLELPTSSVLKEAVSNLETSLALARLEVLLGSYREVADPLSGETAAVVLADLKLRFETSTTEQETATLKKEAVRLSCALGRAIDQWQADDG